MRVLDKQKPNNTRFDLAEYQGDWVLFSVMV